MKMPISEILDRYTITKLKSERTDEDVQEEKSGSYNKTEIEKTIQQLKNVQSNM